MRRGRATLAAAVVLVASLTALAPVASAQVDVQWGSGSASVDFADSIDFRQEISLAETPIRRVELLVSLEGDPGPRVQEVQSGGTLATGVLSELYDLTENHIYPNTDVVGRFRITADDGAVSLGPEISLTYLDDRFEWRSLEGQTPAGSTVRVHWYAGDEPFGQRALEIARQGIAKSEARLGVTERDPIDFYIYGSESDFYGALGPGTRENVGGVSLDEIRTLFAQIRPDDISGSWVEVVIPHELAHLVYHSAVDNPYHDPPRWLNEGLAVYESEGYTGSDRQRIAEAIRAGNLIPIVGLAGLFPTTQDEFFLAYAESVSAVDYMIREHGADALVRLIRSYAEGITDDEAFEAALGMTAAEFDQAWQRDLDVKAPTQYGPQPPPPGPLPSGWSRVPEAAAQPTPEPSAPSTVGPTAPGTAAPTPVVTAVPTAAPTAASATARPTSAATTAASAATQPTASPASPSTTPTSGGLDGGTLGLVLGGLAVVLAVAGIGLILNSRRTRAGR